MNYFCFCVMLVSLVGLMTTSSIGNVFWRRLFKAMTSLLFVATAIASDKINDENKIYHRWIIAGLAFSAVGDVFLAFQGDTYFLLGTISFMVAHIFYIIGFSHLRRICKEDILNFMILLIFLSSILVVGPFDFKNQLVLVITYTLIIGFMVTKAISLKVYYKTSKLAVTLTIVGAVLFLISDTILLCNVFGTGNFNYLDLFNSLTYYIGQDLLALSLSWPIVTNSKKED